MDSKLSDGEKNPDQSGRYRIIIEWWNDIWPLAVLLAGFMTFFRFLIYAGSLSHESYQQFCIAPALLARVGVLWLPILAVGVLVLYRGKWNFHWSAVSESLAIRFLVTGFAAVLVWNYAIMDCNHYFGQWHLIDRGMLVGLCGLVWWSPVAVFPFCLALVAFQGQFDHLNSALPHFWPEKNLPVRMLALFTVYHALVLSFGRRRWPFVFCLLLLVATHYWPSGLSKLKIGWLLHNDLSLVAFSSYANGWQSWLSYDEIVSLSRASSHFSFWGGVLTQIVETIVIFLVWRCKKDPPSDDQKQSFWQLIHRWRMPCILFLLASLHIGIWVGSGICFMTWIIVDLLMLGFIWSLIRRNDSSLRFSTVQQICFIVLVLLGTRWSERTAFSWFETRACYAYRVEAIDESGKLRPVPAQTLAPYGFAFTWTVCNYLYPEKQLDMLFGNVRSSKLANEINALKSFEDFLAFEKERGTVSHDPEKTEKVKTFLKTYFTNLNQMPKALWLDKFQRPCEIESSPRPNAFLGTEKASRVIVKRVTTFFDGHEYSEPRVEKLFEVDIE